MKICKKNIYIFFFSGDTSLDRRIEKKKIRFYRISTYLFPFFLSFLFVLNNVPSDPRATIL